MTTESPLGGRNRLIISAGQYGSGSTWLFNVVGRLLGLARPDLKVRKVYTDRFLDEEIPGDEFDVAVVKSHKPPSAVRLMARLSPTPFLVSIRDPRDAVASVMSRFGMAFDVVLEDVRQSGAALAPLAGSDRVLLLRYEDGFTERRETIDAVAAAIGVGPLSGETREAVWAALTPAAVRETIDGLTAGGVFVGPTPALRFDPATHWHENHVGDGRVGKWRAVLGAAQVERVEAETRQFGEAFGYFA